MRRIHVFSIAVTQACAFDAGNDGLQRSQITCLIPKPDLENKASPRWFCWAFLYFIRFLFFFPAQRYWARHFEEIAEIAEIAKLRTRRITCAGEQQNRLQDACWWSTVTIANSSGDCRAADPKRISKEDPCWLDGGYGLYLEPCHWSTSFPTSSFPTASCLQPWQFAHTFVHNSQFDITRKKKQAGVQEPGLKQPVCPKNNFSC